MIKKLGLFLCLTFGLAAQTDTELYIKKWAPVAQAEMIKFGIPASITLAQGILESASGKSYLAREANNHFGIKCHVGWTGTKVYRDDDAKDECFRAYASADESYRDHSLFLKNRSRYAFLFEEDPTDYKAWAKGLKKAGYATNRKYAHLLIDLIERYDLHVYDEFTQRYQEQEKAGELQSEIEHQEEVISYDSNLEKLFIKTTPNGVDYVVVRPGSTLEKIAEFAGKKPRDLLKYNELRHDVKLKEGQIIYIQPKRRRAAREDAYHIVKPGETMYDISQRFAVKLRHLYRRNDFKIGQQPKVGSKLELR